MLYSEEALNTKPIPRLPTEKSTKVETQKQTSQASAAVATIHSISSHKEYAVWYRGNLRQEL